MSSSTYSQIYLQIIFAVQGRGSLILPAWQEELYKFITGLVKNKKQKLIVINGVQDHIHILLSISPSCRISDLVREIKKSSNRYINENFISMNKFQWQDGYGVFSYNKSAVDKVVKYINNQKEHHKKRNFKEEYINFLEKFEIDYEDEYLFEFLNNIEKE